MGVSDFLLELNCDAKQPDSWKECAFRQEYVRWEQSWRHKHLITRCRCWTARLNGVTMSAMMDVACKFAPFRQLA